MIELVPFATLMERDSVRELATRLFDMGDNDTPDFIAQFMALTMVCGTGIPEADIEAPQHDPSVPAEVLGYAREGCAVFYAPVPDESRVYTPWTCTFSLGASVSFTFQCVTDATQVYNVDDSWTVPGAVQAPPVTNADGTVTVRTTVPAGSPKATTEDLGWDPALHALLATSLWLPVRAAALLG
jgi:hypothetical protein